MDDDGRTNVLLRLSQPSTVFYNASDEILGFSALSEQIPSPVALLNHFGRIIGVNTAWCQQLGFDRYYCAGRTLSDFIDFNNGPGLNVELLRPHNDRPVEHVELPVLDSAGHSLWFEYFAFRHQSCIRVYLDPLGARREVVALREKLAQEETRERFYACVAHELRTSVHGVLGMAELLAQTALDARQRHYVELLFSSGQHLSELSNDLLNFATIKSSSFQLMPAEMPLRNCLKSVVDTFEPLARQKNIRLRGDLDELPERAVGDMTRIRQIFTNLIHNALKFTDSGCISVGVTSVRRIGQHHYELHCFVEDTGRGIPPGQLNSLFAPWQSDSPGESSGLGLAICAQLVRLMGGDITVNSEVGVGSTVVFTLRVGVAV